MTRVREGDEITFSCDHTDCDLEIVTTAKVGIPEGWQQIHDNKTQHSCPFHAWNKYGRRQRKSVTTTDKTSATLYNIEVKEKSAHLIKCRIMAKQVGSSNRAAFVCRLVAYRDVGDNVKIFGDVDDIFTRKSNDAWKYEWLPGSDNIKLTVTGDLTQKIEWSSYIEDQLVEEA